MIIDCIADLHGAYPELEGGDLLIVAGDLVGKPTLPAYEDFLQWMWEQNYKKKMFIAGNHDNDISDYLATEPCPGFLSCELEYLCDSGTEFEGLKIWGMPWTPWFEGVNPHCKAFMLAGRAKMDEKCALIPADTDILVTHGPPYDILDRTRWFESVGCPVLKEKVLSIAPALHVFGHIHEGYGQRTIGKTTFVNCSIMDGDYEFVNKPIRIVL